MSVCVHVDIQLTPSYSPVPAPLSASYYQWVPDFWNDFKVRAVQDKKEIPAQRIRGGPLFFYGDIGNTPVVTGAKIELEYDPQKISAAPLDISVLTPDSQEVETTFDLVKLR